MNRHYRLIVSLVVVLFIMGFFFRGESPIGFVIKEVSADTVSEEVLDEIKEKGEVEVIVILEDVKAERFFQQSKKS